MSLTRVILIVVFVAAIAIRFADAFRPLDQPSWRESDIGSISRNFVREGMNPFYPRIDWRGNGPGYAEMEFPVYPWLIAVGYEIVGQHENTGRIISFLFSLGTLLFFFRLAREYLSEFLAIIAFAFFALNPLTVETATSLQPEGLMIFAYVAAVFFFVRWIRTDAGRDLWPAAIFTALALLAKASAAHIGLFFGFLLIEKYGLSVFRQAKVWAFGIIALVPASVWYYHAKNLWTTYGNSLGVSNEYHWVGLDLFTSPDFVRGLLTLENGYVWMGFGLVVAGFALCRGWRDEIAKRALVWMLSIFVFYVLAVRTTSQNWAYYYHIFSVAPAALIFGLGAKKVGEFAKGIADAYSTTSVATKLLRLALVLIVIGSIFATYLTEAKRVRANYAELHQPQTSLAFANEIAPKLTTPGLILASGGRCFDAHGYQVAYNASYFFYWLDRKGWNVCVDDQSIEKVAEFRSRGAVYFLAEKRYLRENPGFDAQLDADYPTAARSEEYVVYDLTKGN